jgi:NAD(P)-dependent dehydrogenase (short-subunit alcohol dehydrogenase family)
LFAAEGGAVVVSGRSEERGDALAKEINDAGGRAHFVELDIVDQAQWDNAVAETKATFGGLHVLMNIVGSNALSRFPEIDLVEWNKVFEVNLVGTLRGIQTCAPLIKESGGGSIVNIGSVGGMTGAFSTAYSASKWGLEGLSRSAAYVYSDWGIRSNVIQPGWIDTDMTAEMRAVPAVQEMQAQMMSNTVLLRRSAWPVPGRSAMPTLVKLPPTTIGISRVCGPKNSALRAPATSPSAV